MNRSRVHDGSSPSKSSADLESRVVVLEIVSMTALALAMDTSETADLEHAREIGSLIVDTVRHRCDEIGMGSEHSLSACAYADELVSTALLSLYPQAASQSV